MEQVTISRSRFPMNAVLFIESGAYTFVASSAAPRLVRRHHVLPTMPPKTKSQVEHVDGVHCILNIASRMVVVGTGLVANTERDTFKLKASARSGSLAEQVRARPKFARFVHAAAAATSSAETEPPPAQEPKRQRLLDREDMLGVAQRVEGAPDRARKSRNGCAFCLRMGRTFVGVKPELEPEDGIDVVQCASSITRYAKWSGSQFCLPLCDVDCERRQPCPYHWGDKVCFHDPSASFRYQAYAEYAAGIGCRCPCCRRHFDEEVCLFHDSDLHGNSSDALVERNLLRTALTAAGNPECRLKDILELCDTCTGSCGVDLFPGFCREDVGFCGEDVVREMVTELVDMTVRGVCSASHVDGTVSLSSI